MFKKRNKKLEAREEREFACDISAASTFADKKALFFSNGYSIVEEGLANNSYGSFFYMKVSREVIIDNSDEIIDKIKKMKKLEKEKKKIEKKLEKLSEKRKNIENNNNNNDD